MKKLHFTAFAIALIVLLSCSDKPDKEGNQEKKNTSDYVLFLKMKFSEGGIKYKDIYKFNGTDYEVTDGEQKGYTIYESYNGAVENGEEGWEKPDKNKREYAKIVLEQIDKNAVVLLFKSVKGFFKQNWRFNLKYKNGTYEDYLVGKTVELVPFPNEMERYDISLGRGIIAAMSLRYDNTFDIEHSKASITTKQFLLKLNKKQIISTYEDHSIIDLYGASELLE